MELSTFRRHKKRLGLGSNCPKNNRGALGERLFAQAAAAYSSAVQIVSAGRNPHDVRCDHLRVEVKTAKVTAQGWRFHLPNVRHGTGGDSVKSYVRDCDLIALVGLDEHDQLAFVQLHRPRPGNMNFEIGPNLNNVAGLNNWALLQSVTLARAA